MMAWKTHAYQPDTLTKCLEDYRAIWGKKYYSSSSSQKVKALEDFNLEIPLSNIILQDLWSQHVTVSVQTSQQYQLNSTLGKLPPQGSSHQDAVMIVPCCYCYVLYNQILILIYEIKILALKTLKKFFFWVWRSLHLIWRHTAKFHHLERIN